MNISAQTMREYNSFIDIFRNLFIGEDKFIPAHVTRDESEDYHGYAKGTFIISAYFRNETRNEPVDHLLLFVIGSLRWIEYTGLFDIVW